MKQLSKNDIHALAAFFAIHFGAFEQLGLKPRPGSAERAVMSVFGLVEKNGSFRLTARGNRALKLAQSE